MNNNLNEKEQEYTIIHDQEDLTAKNNNSSFAQINTIHNKNKNTNNHNNNHNHNHQYHNHVVIPNHNNSNSSNNNNITINNNNSPIKVDRPLVVARAGSGSGNGTGRGRGREFEYCPWCGRRFQLGEQACPRCRTPRGRAPFVEPAVGPSSPPKVPWRKILYEQQPYEDNYTDKTFLLGLIRNAHKREYDTKTIILDSSTVTQQLCCIALFIVIFIEIYDHNLSLDFILGGEALLTALGFLLRLLFDPKFTMKGMLRAGKSVVVITLTLFGFSPVLRTLVQPFSNDTIWALSISFLLIHIFFHDYGYTHGTSERMDAPVSLNAAIFASVLLGSRLSNSMEVFALLCTAVQVFALFPVVRHHVKRASMKLHLGLTFVLFLITAVCFLELSSTVGIMYIITIVSITFVGPIWLKWLQRYKDEISGPWDEAVPCLN
jgi:phosphatidylinositol glycan class C protein